MTPDEFDVLYRSFARRRPFRPFFVEFTSGECLMAYHPEAVARRGEFHHYRRVESECLFTASSVTRLFDPPHQPGQPAAPSQN